MKTKLSIILLLAAMLAGCTKDPVDMPAGYDRLFYWGRVLMRNDNGGHGTLYYEVRAITEGVPEAAFSKTLPHPWIQ